MTFSLAAALVAALLSAPGVAPVGPPRADGQPTPPTASPPITDMTVEIWPEYDDPRVLVIYRGDVDPSATIPADFSLTIPAGAQVHMAGGVDPKGGHVHALYETHQRDDGLVDISYTLNVPHFYMEFYYDPFSGDDKRDFTYPVVAPSDVNKLVVTIQEPKRAQGFNVSPFTQQVVQDDKGFLYHVIEKADVEAGTSTPVSVSYTKTDREPSVAPQEMGAGAGSSERRTMKNILAFAAVLLVGVAAYGLFLTFKRRDADEYMDEVRSHNRPGTPPTQAAAGFCTQCGQRLAGEDRYCGMCGHPTRTAEERQMAGISGAGAQQSEL